MLRALISERLAKIGQGFSPVVFAFPSGGHSNLAYREKLIREGNVPNSARKARGTAET